MSFLLFCNNFSTTLVTGIGPSDTTMTLTSVAGLPAISGDQYFKLSLFDAATKSITEIVNCTGVTGNVATIVRAQEGTPAKTWNAGDVIAQQWTAGSAAAMEQIAQAQAQAPNYAVDSGTANHVVVALTPALTAAVPGMPVRVKIANANSGATDININGLGAVNVLAANGSALQANDLIAGEIVTFFFNGATYQLDPVGANTVRVGQARLATVPEAEAGSSSSIAVTPAGLAGALAAINSVVPSSIIIWPASAPPAGYLELDGSSLSTSTYAALFAVMGYTFGGSGGSFNLPDARGYFIRGWADSGSIDPGRAFGSTQADQFGSHAHNTGIGAIDTTSAVYGFTTSGIPGGASSGVYQRQAATATRQTITSTTGAADTRPINLALMYCVKY